MNQIGKSIELITSSGIPFERGDIKLTPQTQSLVIGGHSAGFVWKRPGAIMVEKDGKVECIQITDITRLIQICLMFTGFMFSILGFITIQRKGKII